MKTFMLSTLVMLLLSSCGSDPAASCAGSHVGTWTGDINSDVFVFSETCGVTYTLPTPLCNATGTYTATNGAMAITIASKTGSDCIDVGVTNCTYTIGAKMALDCGGGSFNYSH